MGMLLKVLGAFLALMGIANFINLALIDQGDTSVEDLGLGPQLNGTVFLLSSAVVVIVGFVLERRKKKFKETASVDSRIQARLDELKMLRNRGLVSSKEYRIKRDDILRDL